MNDRLDRKGAQPVWKSHEKTSAEKEAWLRPFEGDENLRMMDEETLAKARRYTEELCREDNVFALRLKGYACYGGNRLYECDWTAARDCMLRLRELADDAEYANTLGYIYYYGRCNGGEPEYEKAFPQFSYAAANGLFEAIYKLGTCTATGTAAGKARRRRRTCTTWCTTRPRKNSSGGTMRVLRMRRFGWERCSSTASARR